MSLPEQIDNWGKFGRHHGYEKLMKHLANRLSRREAKQALSKEEEPEDNQHKYKGYTS